MHPIDHQPEPTPSEIFTGVWSTAKVRRTVERFEWVGCWRFGFGYIEFFEDGSARMRITGSGSSYDVAGRIEWNWIDSSRIQLITPAPPLPDCPPTLDVEYQVIRFDERTMWVEMKLLNGALAGTQFTRHLQRCSKSRRPKSWRSNPGGGPASA